MRLAIFSDVHGNREALEAFLRDAREFGVSRYVCLGDIVGYGADPDACVDRIQTLPGIRYIMGNHDAVATQEGMACDMSRSATHAIMWTRKQLSGENIRFLKSAESVLKRGNMIFAHATPHNPREWNYTLHREHIFRAFARTREKLVFVGHTHIPQLIIRKNIFSVALERPGDLTEFSAKPHKRLMVNCGSIGQPRDGDPRASYVIYDTEHETLIFRRVFYDYEKAGARIRSAGLPPYLAERLVKGI